MTVLHNDNPAKRFLRNYRALMIRRESMTREIERLRESVTGTTVQLKQDVVSTSGAGDKIGDTVARIVDAENALGPVLKEIDQRIADIMKAIESVPDEMQKTVLTLRYIESLDWLTVAERIGYEIANTYIIHGRALQEVNRWLTKNGK